MTDKDLRSLGKTDLLKLLHDQALEIEALSAENERLSESVEKMNLNLENAGSIAEASLNIHNIFTTAQQSADLYLENIKSMEEKAKNASAVAEQEARVKAAAIISEAERKCSEREAAEKRYVDELWADLQEKLLQFYGSYSELAELAKMINLLPSSFTLKKTTPFAESDAE